MAEAVEAVRPRVLDSLRVKEGDSRHRHSELVVRSLAGFGDRIESNVLSANDGDEQLLQLQGLLNVALGRFSQ